MKFCIYCGAELTDDAAICLKCGCPAGVKAQEVEVAKTKLNPLALLGFIFSLVAVFVSVFTLIVAANGMAALAFYFGTPLAVAGLVCSIIGLVKSKRNKQRGKGLAIAGIIVGALVFAAWILLLLIGMFYVALVYAFLILIFGII